MKQPNEREWTKRFQKLKDDGFTKPQIRQVFALLSEARAFKYAWLERSAKEQLEEVLQ